MPLGQHVATRSIHLPRAVVDVVAIAVERRLTFDVNRTVVVALAHQLDLTHYAGIRVQLGALVGSGVAEKRDWEFFRCVVRITLLSVRGETKAQRHHGDGRRPIAQPAA